MRTQDLHLEEDERAMRWGWITERVFWAILFAFLCAGALGFFGGSRLTEGAEDSASGLSVEYARFVRHGAETEIKVVLDRKVDETARIWLPNEYLERVGIEQVIPEPQSSRLVDGGIEWTFPVVASSENTVVFRLMPSKVGTANGRIRLGGASSAIAFEQFVYP